LPLTRGRDGGGVCDDPGGGRGGSCGRGCDGRLRRFAPEEVFLPTVSLHATAKGVLNE